MMNMIRTRAIPAALLWIALSLVGATGSSRQAYAGEPSRQDEGRHLIQLIGMENLLLQMADCALKQQVEATRAADPSMPDPVVDIIQDELETAYRDSFDEMLNWAAGLFTDRLTSEEMKETITFYATPAGQKVLRVTPQIMQESMAIGQRWSEQIMIRVGPKIEARLRKAGFTPPSGDRSGIAASPTPTAPLRNRVARQNPPPSQYLAPPPPAPAPIEPATTVVEPPK